ncbi:MAG: NADH-quinone oxidoreductase subunit N [Thermoanaerobaculia bacterium]
MGSVAPQEFWLLLPEMVLAAVGMALLVFGAFGRGLTSRTASIISVVAVGATAVLVVWAARQAPGSRAFLGGLFVLDSYAVFWKMVLLLATALSAILACRFVEEGGYRAGEFFSLLLLAATGMLFMVSGASLLSIWISLELMALASYILAGYFKLERRSNEAAMKYFILGALSSGILLYGISLLYGATGTFQLSVLAERVPDAFFSGGMLVPAGWILLAVGLFFKVSAVPFHVWTPDVYTGAPTPVTGFLAAASKAASFAILIRVFYQGLPALVVEWQVVIAAVSVLSMVWGNLAALTQTNVKRMLAYSSIAHAGYVLMGVLAGTEDGLWAVLFYLLAYSVITIGVFGLVILLERREYAGETYADYAGLASRHPGLAAMMLVFMLALTGIPPTGGFFGKLYLFAAAVQSGWTWVAVIGALTSAISLYYYLGIVVQMYLKDGEADTPSPLRAPGLVAAVGFCAVITVLLGLMPGRIVELARASLIAVP